MSDLECPVCGEQFSAAGYQGHLRFVHDYSVEEAQEAAAAAKAGGVGESGEVGASKQEASEQEAGDQEAEAGSGGPTTAREQAVSDVDGEDDVEATLSAILRRHRQMADVRAVRELQRDGPETRSPGAGIKEFAEAVKAIDDLRGDSGVDETDIARVVRQELANRAATDGGAAASPIEAAIQAGETDIEQLERIAALDRNDRKWDTVDNLLNRAFSSDVVSAVASEVVSEGVPAILGSVGDRPAPRRAAEPPAEEPASEPEPEGDLSPVRAEMEAEMEDEEPEESADGNGGEE